MTTVTEWEAPTLTFDLTETQAICELLTGDPIHARERAAVVEAIRSVAAENGRAVDQNAVRERIPEWVYPRVIGAVYGGLKARGVLVFVRWGESEDHKGRNVGKPARVYRWTGAL